VDEQDAEFEVLEEPKVGLFGRLRSEARVRARVRPTRPRPKEDRRDKRRRGGRAGEGKAGESRSGESRPGDKGADAESGGVETPKPKPAAASASASDRPRSSGSGNGRKGRGGGDRSGGDRSGSDRSSGGSRRGQEREREEGNEVSEDVSLAEQADVAREFLDGLLRELGATGTVQVNEVDEETVEVAVQGADLGLLIGQKGNTLSALQEVTRTVVQRQTGGRNGRLLVDVSGYRQKRREALERFTRQVAEDVLSSGERRALEPMHPADRKVVHDTANTIEGVSTTSEGEEPRRRVVIMPV
jgi:spoIIIJ-associated protein